MDRITKEQVEVVAKKLLMELSKFSIFTRQDDDSCVVGGGVRNGIENGVPTYDTGTHFLIWGEVGEVAAAIIKKGEEIKRFPGLYDAADYIIGRMK